MTIYDIGGELMADVVIFVEQTLSGFAADAEFGGVYMVGFNFGDDIDAFTIIQGETYKVLWDETWYTVVAEDASSIIEGCLFLGNGSMYGLSGNNEPFVIGWVEGGVTFLSLTETVDTHTIAIYQVVEDEEPETPPEEETPEGIVLKDRNGTDVEHIGASAIRVRTTDGGTKKFLDSDTMQPLEVTENGTYAVEGNSCGYSPVTVKVPAPVLQEKTITENGEYTADSGFDGLSKVIVEVAGSGGGGFLDEPLVATGTFKPTAAIMTFNHNLGVVPDYISIYSYEANSGNAAYNTVFYAMGYRTGLTFPEQMQKSIVQQTGAVPIGFDMGIDTAGTNFGGFKNANATSVTFGGSIAKLDTNAEYEWIARRITPY